MSALCAKRLQEDLQDLLDERARNDQELAYLRSRSMAGCSIVLVTRHQARLRACEKLAGWISVQIEATRCALAREQVAA